jgi:cysteine desulfurase/selenocysteine lyase
MAQLRERIDKVLIQAMQNIREQFPVFKDSPNVIYFDNASTTQKPTMVIDAVQAYLKQSSNVGRASYPWAVAATKEVEAIRALTAQFINASSKEEIVFTSGATESINTIAYAWGLHNLKSGDEILYNPFDHASNVLPWENVKGILKKFGTEIVLVSYKILENGEIDLHDLLSKISTKTKLITFSHIHHIFGAKSSLSAIRNKIPKSITLACDLSQSIGKTEVDVQKLEIDFASFSGHKMFASTGTGVLYINESRHRELHQFMPGGSTDVVMPRILESGTPNIAGIFSLGAAIKFINDIGIEVIQEDLTKKTHYLLSQLRSVKNIEFLPGLAQCGCEVGYGIISFKIAGISCQDADFILSANNIFVRTGSHCVYGTKEYNDSIRVSLDIYNTHEEIDRFIAVVKNIVESI